jgi:hypothetical protein
MAAIGALGERVSALGARVDSIARADTEMKKFRCWVQGKKSQTETILEVENEQVATFRFAAMHGLKTYEIYVKEVK